MIGIIIALWRFFASRLKSREQLEAENVALRQQLTRPSYQSFLSFAHGVMLGLDTQRPGNNSPSAVG